MLQNTTGNMKYYPTKQNSKKITRRKNYKNTREIKKIKIHIGKSLIRGKNNNKKILIL